MFNAYLKKLLHSVKFRNRLILGLFLLPIAVTLALFFSSSSDEFSRMGTAVYQSVPQQANCAAGSRPGPAGATNGEATHEGIKYNVRTPLNYDPTIGHPLLMVYAPAKANRAKTEQLTGLTYAATSAGLIVAYADHPELSPSSTVELGTIPELIAQKWCIDAKRIFLTGHSDGGTVAMVLGFMAKSKLTPAAIAPSAAGVNHQDFYNRNCPAPLSVMIMHSAKDRLFPGFGIETSGWWAACNSCDPIPEKMSNGCVAYTGCADGVKTWYCEGDKPHAQWPALNGVMIEFFASSGTDDK